MDWVSAKKQFCIQYFLMLKNIVVATNTSYRIAELHNITGGKIFFSSNALFPKYLELTWL